MSVINQTGLCSTCWCPPVSPLPSQPFSHIESVSSWSGESYQRSENQSFQTDRWAKRNSERECDVPKSTQLTTVLCFGEQQNFITYWSYDRIPQRKKHLRECLILSHPTSPFCSLWSKECSKTLLAFPSLRWKNTEKRGIC